MKYLVYRSAAQGWPHPFLSDAMPCTPSIEFRFLRLHSGLSTKAFAAISGDRMVVLSLDMFLYLTSRIILINVLYICIDIYMTCTLLPLHELKLDVGIYIGARLDQLLGTGVEMGRV